MNEKYLIEIRKNGRFFYITEYEGRVALTWIVDMAKEFNSVKEADEFAKDAKYCTSGYTKLYDILPLSECKNW